MNRYMTIYRGNVTTGKEFTEIGFQPKFLLGNILIPASRWYLNPSDSSLDRLSRLITRKEPITWNTEILQDSVYITLKFEDKL